MAADLHIHVVYPEDLEDDARKYMDKEWWHSLKGNGYTEYRLEGSTEWKRMAELSLEEMDSIVETRDVSLEFAEEAVQNTPSVWIGEVSWLKAAIFQDESAFVPNAVGKIRELIDNFPVLTEELISKIEEAFESENTTTYSLADKDAVVSFLRTHLGRKVFPISW